MVWETKSGILLIKVFTLQLRCLIIWSYWSRINEAAQLPSAGDSDAACVCAYAKGCLFLCDKGAIEETEPSRGETEVTGFPSPSQLSYSYQPLHNLFSTWEPWTEKNKHTNLRRLNIDYLLEVQAKLQNLKPPLSSLNLFHFLAVISKGPLPLSEEYNLVDKQFHIHRVAC